MKDRSLIIFDLDGTLFQTDRVTVAAARRCLAAGGVAPPEESAITYFIGKPGEEMFDWLRSLCPRDAGASVIEAYDRMELDLVPTAGALFPGVREALAEVRSLGRTMAICTNGQRRYVERVVGSHGLDVYFDTIRYRKTGDGSKSSMVRELLAELGGGPAVVVGDRGDDIEAARRNGIAAIAATYGYGSREKLAPADATVASAAETPEMANRLLERV